MVLYTLTQEMLDFVDRTAMVYHFEGCVALGPYKDPGRVEDCTIGLNEPDDKFIDKYIFVVDAPTIHRGHLCACEHCTRLAKANC